MQFLADENFRFDVIELLRATGHDVAVVTPRTLDEEVAAIARREKRILLTHDNDFAVTLKFPPAEYSGILVFRIPFPTFAIVRRALASFLNDKTPALLSGKAFVIGTDFVIELK